MMSEKSEVPFILKGGLEPMTILRINRLDIGSIEAHLEEKVTRAPEMFNNTPVIVDLQPVSEEEDATSFDASALFSLLKLKGLIPIAVRNGNPHQLRCAIAAGIGVLEGRIGRNEGQTEATIAPPPAQEPLVKYAAKIVEQQVHSGRQVYADQGRDLIIVGSVSAGAEVLADGCIHIYGALRGRALAGVKGDSLARIFCHNMAAELVSIAGSYQLFEDNSQHRAEPTQVFLEDDRIIVKSI